MNIIKEGFPSLSSHTKLIPLSSKISPSLFCPSTAARHHRSSPQQSPPPPGISLSLSLPLLSLSRASLPLSVIPLFPSLSFLYPSLSRSLPLSQSSFSPALFLSVSCSFLLPPSQPFLSPSLSPFFIFLCVIIKSLD